MTTPKGTEVRKEFYARATHILFAIVLAHSFLLASEILVPISVAFQPENHMSVTTLLFSYVLIISGWIGYSRSVSYRPYKDTAWGAMRFVFDIIILFEYFYLVGISVEQPDVFPFVVVVIAATYLITIRRHQILRAPTTGPPADQATKQEDHKPAHSGVFFLTTLPGFV